MSFGLLLAQSLREDLQALDRRGLDKETEDLLRVIQLFDLPVDPGAQSTEAALEDSRKATAEMAHQLLSGLPATFQETLLATLLEPLLAALLKTFFEALLVALLKPPVGHG